MTLVHRTHCCFVLFCFVLFAAVVAALRSPHATSSAAVVRYGLIAIRCLAESDEENSIDLGKIGACTGTRRAMLAAGRYFAGLSRTGWPAEIIMKLVDDFEFLSWL